MSLRLFQAGGWFETRDREETQAGARQSPIDSIQGAPDITIIWKVEARWENAGNRQRLIGYAHPLTQYGRASAKMTLPILIADQRRRGIPGFLFLGAKESADRR